MNRRRPGVLARPESGAPLLEASGVRRRWWSVRRAVASGGNDPSAPLRERTSSDDRHEPFHSVSTPRRKTLALHLATLVLAAVYLGATARNVRLYYDDWALVAALQRDGLSTSWLLAPHNEHWILVPKLVFWLLSETTGFAHPWAFVAIVVLLHVVLAHLLWRLAVLGGADPIVATIGTVGFLAFTGGVEAVLWAVEMSLLGAMVLGTACLLEVGRTQPRGPVIAAVSTLAVLCAGIAPVFLVLAAVVLARRQAWRRLPWLAPAAALFFGWYLWFSPVSAGDADSWSMLALVPLYWMVGVGNVLLSIVPWRPADELVAPSLDPWTGMLALGGVALLAGVTVLVWRRPYLRPSAPVGVYAAGCAVVFALAAGSRTSYGLATALSSRYVYIGAAFLVPLLLVLVSRLVVGRRSRTAVLTGTAIVAVANVLAWPAAATVWVDQTRTSARVLTAAQALVRSGEPTLPEMAGTPELAFLGPAALRDLPVATRGDVVTARDVATARLAAQVALVRDSEETPVCAVGSAPIRLPVDEAEARVVVPRTAAFEVALDVGGETSHPRVTRFLAGSYRIRSVAPGGTVVLQPLGSGAMIGACS